MKRVLSVVCGLACLSCWQAGATTFPIANGDIAGLKAAIISANSNGQDDIILLAAHGLYDLTTRDNALNGLPPIQGDSGHKLTIYGNGSTIQRSTASGIPTFRILYIASGGNLTVANTVFFNGFPGAFHGGAIYNDGSTANATLTLTGCVFDSNQGDYGGAIWNDGSQQGAGVSTATLTVGDCRFVNNVGSQYGGAIWNESGHVVLNVSNSTFDSNAATARTAGAIQVDGSAGTITATIANCTFTRNSAANYGGAINVDGVGGFNGLGNPTNGSAIVNVIDCTFDQNTAQWGGAIALDGSDSGAANGNATVKVDSCTFSRNFSNALGDAIYLLETTSGTTVLQIGNSILASADPAGDYNISTDNITGGTTTVTSSGYNLSDDAACGVNPCNDTGTAPGGLLNHAGDQRNTNPLLDPAGLKNNGGLTQTIALQATSPALDRGSSNTILHPSADQRGLARTFDDPNVANATGGDGTDIGAYEASINAVSASKSGSDYILNFNTVLGRTYQVQTRASLTSGTWTNVTNTVPVPPISGTGGIVTVTVTNAFAFNIGFYRLLQL